jgi:hypothetical protein
MVRREALATTCRVLHVVNEPIRSLLEQHDRDDEYTSAMTQDVTRFARSNLVREIRGGLVAERSFSPTMRPVDPALKERLARLERIKYKSGVTFAGFGPGATGVPASTDAPVEESWWPVAICFPMPVVPLSRTGTGSAERSAGFFGSGDYDGLDCNGSCLLPPRIIELLDTTYSFRKKDRTLRARSFVTITGWVRPTSHVAVGMHATATNASTTISGSPLDRRRRPDFNATTTALTSTMLFQQQQRKDAIDRKRREHDTRELEASLTTAAEVRDRRLAEMRVLASLNGEAFLEPSEEIKTIMAERRHSSLIDVEFLRQLELIGQPSQRYSSAEARLKVEAVLEIEERQRASPLRQLGAVPPSVPRNFERYDGLEVVRLDAAIVALAPSIGSTSQDGRQLVSRRSPLHNRSVGDEWIADEHGEAAALLRRDVLNPRFFTRTWAAPISRLRADVVAQKHVGFVKALLNDLNWAPPLGPLSLTELLGSLPAGGTCSLDVTAPDGGGFRHSFAFTAT